jgi:hypothetical protein
MLRNLIPALRNFLRTLRGDEPQPQAPETTRRAAEVTRAPPRVPEPSAPCWRRLIVGQGELATGNVALQLLLRNNVRFVELADAKEDVIAQRIRITHGFFARNQPSLGAEIQSLSQLGAEAAQ